MGRSRSSRRREHKRQKRLAEKVRRFQRANDALGREARLLNSVRWQDPNAFWIAFGLLMEKWRKDARTLASQLRSGSVNIPLVWDKRVMQKRVEFIESLELSKNAAADQREKKLIIEELREFLRSSFVGLQPFCTKQLNATGHHEMR